MDKPAEICETYQLKWSSYNSYIHSCIATSLHSDSYADVALVTVDGHQIMAHRYILSYSSQYFNQILKFQPKVTTALPLMIVMPPEIDYKSLKVLVRYMYSGEAKVSKEILNTVLKGGDILQIKGLYRENDDQERNARAKKTQQPQKGVNSATSTVVTNPVAVQQSTNANPVATQSATNKPTQNVLHKSSHASTSAAATVPSSSTEKNTSSTSQPQQTTQTVTTTTGRKFLIVQKPKDQQTYLNQRPKVLNFTIMQPFDVAGQNPKEPVTILNKDIDQNKSDGKADQTKKKDDAPVTVKTEPSPMKDTSLQYLVIKDEPVEWNEADMEFIDSKEILEDMTIKSENTENYETESNSNEGENSVFAADLRAVHGDVHHSRRVGEARTDPHGHAAGQATTEG
ncbi:hypothetical protein NQ318_009481 [Aromia moschata]|uniref:BTB domain-containing protein n=1 Tax=Aromia moschata TaxID=1265417 RepID=A0AAV8Z7E6_9CUCU|nr:hypothetical protein NQ318_009481 [Aromia moschata]